MSASSVRVSSVMCSSSDKSFFSCGRFFFQTNFGMPDNNAIVFSSWFIARLSRARAPLLVGFGRRSVFIMAKSIIIRLTGSNEFWYISGMSKLLAQLFFRWLVADCDRLRSERDEAHKAYIRVERLLSLYRPTMPVNISDRKIAERLSREP